MKIPSLIIYFSKSVHMSVAQCIVMALLLKVVLTVQ